jgi:hypothetical protein
MKPPDPKLSIDILGDGRHLSDMETNAREFARNFARYRRAAARGEKVLISAPDGVFSLIRESRGMTGSDLLARLGSLRPGRGLFPAGGADRIEAAGRPKTPARSPWDA